MSKLRLLKLATLCLLLALPRLNTTNAYFFDSMLIEGNVFSTGCWLPPEVPLLIAPSDETTYQLSDIITFSWNAVDACPTTTGVWYQVSVYQSAKLLRQSPYIESLTYTFNEPFPAGEYQWQVTAKDDEDRIGEASSLWSFLVVAPPTAPLVVINEVMWSGSSASAGDEWLELYNPNGYAVNLANWRIKYGAKGKEGHFQLPAKQVISAHSYFVIARFDAGHRDSALRLKPSYINRSLNLDDDYLKNSQLVLEDATGATIDQTPLSRTRLLAGRRHRTG
jgi:hypothetical protein